MLVLGSAPAVDLDCSRAVVDAGDIKVHVVAPDGLDLGGLAELAASTGGVVPSMPALVGEIDVATAAIAQRYRVEATVDGGGPRELAVVVDGVRHVATVDIPAGAGELRPSTSIDDRTTIAAAAPPPATDATAPATAAPATATATSSGGGSATASLVIGALAALAIAAVGVWVVMRRRGSGDDDVDAAVVVSSQPKPVSPNRRRLSNRSPRRHAGRA